MALGAAKAVAPILGPILSDSSQGSARRGRGGHSARGGESVGLALAGAVLENLVTALDAAEGVLEVTGVETVLYLDDSCSMSGRTLPRDARRCEVSRAG